MLENGSQLVNSGDPYSLLDAIGFVSTPTTGYTEDGLGGDTARFHGPFQRWMTLGNASGATTMAKVIGRRVHMKRYCLVL